jgi:nucleotide-binding universal stress UspA family protein
MPYRRIVVGTDGSETAAVAVRHAATLAAAFGGELVVVTAFRPQPQTDRPHETEVPDDLRWAITDSAVAEEHARHAAGIAKEVGLEKIRVRSERGDPADALVSVADDAGADLIVVGSRGMTSASRFVLGSVPNKVSHHAPCDVMIVHTVG